MTAIFPDSGVPWSDAKNSLQNPGVEDNCDPLWYSSSRCQPRFDPAAANAVLSELINVVNKGLVDWDCNKLDNLQLGIRYLIQRGLPCTPMLVGPQHYTATLDPPALSYDDLTLILRPETTNTGPVRLAVNGMPEVPVYRNDGTEMKPGDVIAGVPFLTANCGGNFYHIGFVKSQVMPAVMVGFRADAQGFGPQSIPTSVGVLLAFYHVIENTMTTSVFDGINLTIGPGEDGIWNIHGQWVFPQDSTGTNNFGTAILVNNGMVAFENTNTPAMTASSCSCSVSYRLHVGDKVNIQAYQQSGHTVNTETSARQFFSAYKVSA